MKRNWYITSIIGSNIVVLLVSYLFFGLRRDSSDSGNGATNKDSVVSERYANVSDRISSHTTDTKPTRAREDRIVGRSEKIIADDQLETGVNPAGGLSSELIKKFGISHEQFVNSQLLVSSYWTDMATWAGKSVFYDSVASSTAADGANVFRLPAMDPEERDMRLEALSKRMAHAANKEMAEAVITDLSKSQSFAGMGKYDVVFKFRNRESQEVDPETLQPVGDPEIIENDATVEYSYTDPKTGNIVLSSNGGSVSQVASEFGDIFQMDQQE